ncbi:MAG: hypothetical protein PHI98_15185 [Eubacteriales bacterium]|nr:hypothetical protein [Eubacteriales bacterium]
MEKPIATEQKDAQALWEAYLQGGKPLVVVSFPLRVTSIALRAREI